MKDILSMLMLVLALFFGLVSPTMAGVEPVWFPTTGVKFMPGLEVSPSTSGQGSTLSALTGWVPAGDGQFSSIWGLDRTIAGKDGTTTRIRLLDLGVADIGLGTRFGADNATEGSKLTTHVGLGGCLFTLICASYVYNFIENLPADMDRGDRFRVNVTGDLGYLIRLIPVPGSGSGP